MKVIHIFWLCFIVLAVACKKEDTPPPPPPPETTPDIVSLRLKDLNESHLPSPYYHFDYNDSGYIIQASFASEANVYGVSYADRKIAQIAVTSGATRDKLQYEYSNGFLSRIIVTTQSGAPYRKCAFTYNSAGQLQQLEWEVVDVGGAFKKEETQQFAYYTDGNLKELVDHFHEVGPVQDMTFTDSFADYDSHVNADGFELLQNNLHHLILLPSINVQPHNPRRNVRTGDGVNYEINYSYTYDAQGRPVIKNGDLLFTNGTDSGRHFQTQSTFSYY